ncbi:MAG: hypothetical protein JWO38_4725 [Gemmataceae bacterium]|nr:hypothetical protein [Gemmataceae bacterium]
MVSCLPYGMGLVRRAWYGRDLDGLEFIVGRLWPGGRSCGGRANGTVRTTTRRPGMEVIVKKGQEIETMRMTDNKLGGEGEKLGTAYRLTSGKVVYVPDGGGLPGPGKAGEHRP